MMATFFSLTGQIETIVTLIIASAIMNTIVQYDTFPKLEVGISMNKFPLVIKKILL